MAKKKKKERQRSEPVKKEFQIVPFLFLAIYAVISLYLFAQLFDKPFMNYMKGARYLWIVLFWAFTGILGYNLFQIKLFTMPHPYPSTLASL